MTKSDIHPEHISPDYHEMVDRLTELRITQLSDDVGVKYDPRTEGVTMYANLQAYTPQAVGTLADYEMWALVDWWLDGHCKCGNEISQAHYICRNCLDEALNAYGLRLA